MIPECHIFNSSYFVKLSYSNNQDSVELSLSDKLLGVMKVGRPKNSIMKTVCNQSMFSNYFGGKRH